ncbi:MAG: ribonuclease P protein component [Proteobacteria bacterium]|nr:ribonuclease P protein component [Pseudomonadota bacterium]
MGSTLLRLKNRSDFLRAQRGGRKWVTPGLILQARARDAEEPIAGDASAIRVGFTVSKKVGNAVVRNRAKRRLRAIAENILTEHAIDHHDYVLIGRAGTRRRNYAALLDDLEVSLRKLGAYAGVTSK